MGNDISEQLEKFISNFFLTHFKKPMPISELKLSTNIETDLGITGDDADLFLTNLVAEFHLDAKEFKGDQYFGHESEGFDWVFPVIRFFLGQRKWMPLPKSQRREMTVEHLIKCIAEKKLI